MIPALLGLTQLLLPGAAAHPYQPDYYSLKSSLRVGDAGLEGAVVLEIPLVVVWEEVQASYVSEGLAPGEEAAAAYTQKQWDALSSGVHLTLDGRALAGQWIPAEDPRNGKLVEGFFVYIIRWEGEAKDKLPKRGTIRLENRAYPGLPMYYSRSVEEKAPWTSDWVPDAEDWTQEEGARVLEFQYRRPR